MPKGTVVAATFGSLGVIVFPECLVVLHHVVSSIHESIAKGRRSPFGHPGLLRREVSGLVNGRIETCKGKQLRGFEKRCMSPISPRIIPPLMGPMPGMVMMTESREKTMSLISDSIASIWLSSSLIWAID